SVAGGVAHDDDQPADAVHEVHRPAHPLDHFTGDGPVGQVAAGGDLHGAEDGDVDVAAADHAERQRGVEVRGAGQRGHRLLARVDQVGVDLVVRRVRADAEDAVLGVQRHPAALRHEAGDERGQPDAEVHVGAVGQLGCGAGGDLLPGPAHRPSPSAAPRTVLSSMGLSAACSGVSSTTRCTTTRGRCPASGSISPGSTSRSTSATVTRPAIAASGLKLRAALWNTRLPCRSPSAARTSAKSVVMLSSSTYSLPPNSRTSLGGEATATVPSGAYRHGSPPSATIVPTPAGV